MGLRVALIGYGRFGALWASILAADFDLYVWDSCPDARARAVAANLNVTSLEDTLASDVLFYAVPISHFESTIHEHRSAILHGKKRTIIDLLSVKVYPRDVLTREFGDQIQAILTHPMFGPDSVSSAGLQGQRIVVDKFSASDEQVEFWCAYFRAKQLQVVELSAEEHDRLAAESQGLTHFIGRILGTLNFNSTPIDTLGASMLQEIKSQVCRDSWQLFVDLQTFNPFTREMRVRLGEATENVYAALLPNRRFLDRLVVGIQGGRGSFNEEAARTFLTQHNIADFELKYLFTTENVLRELHAGTIDRGQFAIHNSLGGIVHESVHAMSRYQFTISEEFGIPISHAFMIHPSATIDTIEEIMTHPQVLRQCKHSLETRFPSLKQTSGSGEMIDSARAAEALSQGEIPPTTAVMGSRQIAEIYGLQIVATDLQDLANNITSFLWVERPTSSGRSANR